MSGPRRSRTRRARSKRDKGGGGPPSRSHAQSEAYAWTERNIEELRRVHEARSPQAQATDRALTAPIASTPGHWVRQPGRLDIHGVDYPELKTPKAKRGLKPHVRMVAVPKKEEKVKRPVKTRVKPPEKPKDEPVIEIPDRKPEPEPKVDHPVLTIHEKMRQEASQRRYGEYENDIMKLTSLDYTKSLRGAIGADFNLPREMKQPLFDLLDSKRQELQYIEDRIDAAKTSIDKAKNAEDVRRTLEEAKASAIPQLSDKHLVELNQYAEKVWGFGKDPARVLSQNQRQRQPKGGQDRQRWKQGAAALGVLNFMHDSEDPEYAAVIESTGDGITITGMDPSHVAMAEVRIKNPLINIPPGKYRLTESEVPKSPPSQSDPTEIAWDAQSQSLIFNKKTATREDVGIYRLKEDPKATPYKVRLNYGAEYDTDTGTLRKVLESAQANQATHINIIVESDPDTGEDTVFYHWKSDIGGHGGHTHRPAGPWQQVKNDTGEEVLATYEIGGLNDIFDHIDRMGLTDAKVRFSTDTPISIKAESKEIEAEHWLAPCIGVSDKKELTADERRSIRQGLARKTVIKIPENKRDHTRFHRDTMLYTLLADSDDYKDAQVTVQGDKVTIVGMNIDNTAMIEATTPNTLNLPDGEHWFEAAGYKVSRALLNSPESVEYYPENKSITLTKGPRGTVISILESKDLEYPRPKLNHTTHIDAPPRDLLAALKEAEKHMKKSDGREYVALSHEDGQLTVGYTTEDGETKKIAVTDRVRGDEVTNYYPIKQLKQLAEKANQGDAQLVSIHYSKDAPMEVDIDMADTVIKFWLAPAVGY